ncbi:M48 family metallopeptidase, partial [Pseudomonas aeruginosa]
MTVPARPQGKRLSFFYGDERIEVLRQARTEGIRRVLIKVHPDCQVMVSAPSAAGDGEVLDALRKRGRWIHEQLREFRKQLEHVTPRRYASGESHYYLGKQHLLKVIEAPGEVQGVKLYRGKLEVMVREKSPEKVKQLLTDWYKARAKEVFTKRLEAM